MRTRPTNPTEPLGVNEQGIKVYENWRHQTPELMDELHAKVQRLVEETVGVDVDGDCGVRIILVNKRTEEMPYEVAKRLPDDPTDADMIELLSWLNMNARIAQERLGRHINYMRYRHNEQQRQKEEVRANE